MSQSGERVAGFVVSRGESIFGGGVQRSVSASAVHVIGPDAITVSGAAAADSTDDLASLPRVSDVTGRKMVSRSGRLLGSIADVLINPEDGTIIGFSLGEGAKSKFENLFGGEKASATSYVRADADLQVGKDLIVVPDEALVQQTTPVAAPSSETPDTPPASDEATTAVPIATRKWGGPSTGTGRKSVWASPLARSSSGVEPSAPATGEAPATSSQGEA